MISLSWNSNFEPNSFDADKHIGALMRAYRELPRHIARKHLGASMRRVLRPAVPILRRNTPPTGVRRGRRKKGEKARSTGALRRAATIRVGQTGTNKAFDAFVARPLPSIDAEGVRQVIDVYWQAEGLTRPKGSPEQYMDLSYQQRAGL
ncbi:MAG: hypothetical protein LW892_12080 [Betaproteobacteria bacterium]|jgi:hypothetical protein|nr:hypothetical protein [Betaproteobacteria bacterium]